MFPSLAALEHTLRKQILLLGNKKMFLPQVKNILAFRKQILLPKHMFHSNVGLLSVLLITNVF